MPEKDRPVFPLPNIHACNYAQAINLNLECSPEFNQRNFASVTTLVKMATNGDEDRQRTKDYIASLQRYNSDMGKSHITKKGNSKAFQQGTWLHPKLAVSLLAGLRNTK